jgi:hypothetical protein
MGVTVAALGVVTVAFRTCIAAEMPFGACWALSSSYCISKLFPTATASSRLCMVILTLILIDGADANRRCTWTMLSRIPQVPQTAELVVRILQEQQWLVRFRALKKAALSLNP